MSFEGTYTEGQEVDEDGSVLLTKRKRGLTKYHITVEPIKICLGFAINLTNGVMIDVLERNVCHLKYNLTEAQCYENMTPDVKTLVEGMTADVNMINQAIQGIFSLILTFFVGPWSDDNGRKPFILVPLLGYSVYYLLWAVLSYFPNVPIIYYFIPSIPLGLSGMMPCLFVCTWSYTCDNFDPEERPIRFSMSVTSFTIGNIAGNALSGHVMSWTKPYGFQVIFATSFIMTLMGFIYTVFFLEETRIRPQGVSISQIINFENIKRTFVVMLIRPEKGVLLSVLIITILLCEIPLNAGDDGILYLVGKTQYSWDLKTYNLIVVMSSIIAALAPMFFIWLLQKIFKCSNITVLIISFFIFATVETLKALSPNQTMFWVSVITIKLAGFVGPVIDTELSEIASQGNTGKAFTLTSICDALSPALSIPLYTVIYKMFLPNNTLYVFFTSAVLAIIALTAVVGIFFKKSSTVFVSPYRALEVNG